MAFIPIPNVVQARIQYLHTSGVVAENVFYNACAGVPTETDLADLHDLYQVWCTDALSAIITVGWSITGVNLRAMNEEEGISLNDPDGFPIAGDNTDPGAPLQVCYTVTWSTGYVGRSARGRTYGLGVTLNETIGGNRLTDAARAAFQTRWYGLLSSMEAGGHALQVVSFQEGGVPRTAGRALPVVAVNVRFPLATQRRRLS